MIHSSAHVSSLCIKSCSYHPSPSVVGFLSSVPISVSSSAPTIAISCYPASSQNTCRVIHAIFFRQTPYTSFLRSHNVVADLLFSNNMPRISFLAVTTCPSTLGLITAKPTNTIRTITASHHTSMSLGQATSSDQAQMKQSKPAKLVCCV